MPLRCLVFLIALVMMVHGHAQQLTQVVILVASPRIDDPYFAESVVLVVRRGGGPPLGLILNRPLPWPAGKIALRPFFGGPVMQERGFYLVEQPGVVAGDVLSLGFDIHLVSGEASLARLRESSLPPRQIRRFLGYSGWGHGQLDNEINRGDWTLLPFDPAMLFLEDVSGLWQELRQKANRRTI